MGSPMRLDRCHTALFDHGVNVNIPEHTAVRTFSSEHRLRDLLKAQPCGGVRVQIERKRNCRAAAGEGWKWAAKVKTRAAKSTEAVKSTMLQDLFCLGHSWGPC